jgi:Domain of unknown function (DUF4440)
MTVQTELLALERRFWTGDADFYRRNLDEECLTAFSATGRVASKEQIAASVGTEQRWRRLKIELHGLVAPTPEFAIVTYRADATRQNGESYSALVSSGYVKRDGAWKLAFHQQTPLDEPETAEGAGRWPRDPLDAATAH